MLYVQVQETGCSTHNIHELHRQLLTPFCLLSFPFPGFHIHGTLLHPLLPLSRPSLRSLLTSSLSPLLPLVLFTAWRRVCVNVVNNIALWSCLLLGTLYLAWASNYIHQGSLMWVLSCRWPWWFRWGGATANTIIFTWGLTGAFLHLLFPRLTANYFPFCRNPTIDWCRSTHFWFFASNCAYCEGYYRKTG